MKRTMSAWLWMMFGWGIVFGNAARTLGQYGAGSHDKSIAMVHMALSLGAAIVLYWNARKSVTT